MKLQIEGMDGIGKTALANNLKSELEAQGKPVEIFRFERFPGQDAMEDLQRWAWMDYVHLHVARLTLLSEPKLGLIFDRGPASNFVLRALRLIGYERVLALSVTSLLQFADNLYTSESFTQLREAEHLLSRSGVTTILLQPIIGSDWLALRNLYRHEPDYACIPDSVQAVIRLYDVWSTITPLHVTPVYLTESDTSEEVSARVFEALNQSTRGI